MKRPLGDMCANIASDAAARNHEFLAHLLRIAAIEADASAPGETYAPSRHSPEGPDAARGLNRYPAPVPVSPFCHLARKTDGVNSQHRCAPLIP
jgi:hypothetical protein